MTNTAQMQVTAGNTHRACGANLQGQTYEGRYPEYRAWSLLQPGHVNRVEVHTTAGDSNRRQGE